jgi:hypothetical protein
MLYAATIPFLLPTSLEASTGAGVCLPSAWFIGAGQADRIHTAAPFLLPIDDWAASIVWLLESLRGRLRT